MYTPKQRGGFIEIMREDGEAVAELYLLNLSEAERGVFLRDALQGLNAKEQWKRDAADAMARRARLNGRRT